MKIRVGIVATLLLGAASGILAFQSYHKQSSQPGREKLIVSLVGDILKSAQYHPKIIDDKFSMEVFDKYLRDLDPQKDIFLQNDINQLDQFRTKIDDEINTDAPLEFFNLSNKIYVKRVGEVSGLYKKILEHPFDFIRKETIQLDRSKDAYPSDDIARSEYWRKYLKYRTLDRFIELQDIQKKTEKDSVGYKPIPDSILQREARTDVASNMKLYFDRLNSTVTEKERFSMFVNDITTTMDPHTEYFPPVDQRSFDEQMSGTFYGIGAQLMEDNGIIKIASIVTGGPAWKEGELKAGDIILKVGQGDKPPLDINGYGTEDAVKIIRGDKGTIVKLTLKQTDGTIKTITIVRGEVKLDATFAKSYIIQDGTHRIGIINLPEFYAPFNNGKGGSSSGDMKKEVEKLQAAHVDGIIVDLRFDGGGSLEDAIKIAGLFIPSGPVVQVRSRNGRIQVLNCHDSNVAFEGPLAVMVNEYSASASEIFTAAMQDYHRAIIIGSPSTYGKGTVQRMIDLDYAYNGDLSQVGGSLGALKITLQKFYRVNGGSTQIKGVSPDIILPDEYFNVAERTDSDALAWDQIARANYTPWVNPVNIPALQDYFKKLIDTSKVFHLIRENIDLLKSMEQKKVYSLNIDQFRQQQKYNDEALKRMNEIRKITPRMKISFLPSDIPYIHSDSTRSELYSGLLKSYRRDPYLEESIQVMNNLIGLSTVQSNKLSRN